ncbi:serine hydrolase [Aquimarina aggregata]|uniref:Serine hydrolase n=1 Tax=Aquimarina aggregata TaxID=1642818 RepID=A0A162WSP9_9FLAO|nr:serine hydrolase [Aquimarina aggregata]KZS38276.1 serine hydrolase [Aquimarina aggregata]
MTFKNQLLPFNYILLVLFFVVPLFSFAQNLEGKFDTLLREKYKSDGSGATILVAKRGDIIYHKAFGLANIELDVPMRPNHVFEIGSITKQFTSIAILMLMEQGKLSIEDEITKFIPDYPTHGKKITIHHLLNHTSGIKSYTSMNLSKIARNDMTPTEMIDYFKNEPLDFDPGDKWSYSNSGYFILGYIIEKISKQTYEDFVEQHIFKKLQMNSSRYGHKSEIIKNRASGYQTKNGYINSNYLSMTLPYAAGSLMSTVEDLFKWQTALNKNSLVKKETLQKAYTNYSLNNGDPTNYGYGWLTYDVNDVPAIQHGGGIFGYTSYEIYVPKEDVYVVILTNCNCNSPANLAKKIAAMAIGKPYHTAKTAINIPNQELKKFIGVYEFEDKAIRIITLKENQLYSKREGSTEFKIFPKNQSSFFFEDNFSEYKFEVSQDPIKVIFTDRNSNNISKGIKTNKPIPLEKKIIKVPINILKQYVGIYEIKPGFDITIKLENDKLISQATGQESFEIHAETKTKFFIKEFPATIEFIMKNNKTINAILHQANNKISAKRKK